MKNKNKNKTDEGDHDAAAQEAKYHLRNDKDLNRAHPLTEKIPEPKTDKGA